jgi:hypothetical protein
MSDDLALAGALFSNQDHRVCDQMIAYDLDRVAGLVVQGALRLSHVVFSLAVAFTPTAGPIIGVMRFVGRPNIAFPAKSFLVNLTTKNSPLPARYVSPYFKPETNCCEWRFCS